MLFDMNYEIELKVLEVWLTAGPRYAQPIMECNLSFSPYQTHMDGNGPNVHGSIPERIPRFPESEILYSAQTSLPLDSYILVDVEIE
jgi:NAD/FAD-utilizing enzyme apparently involved in cell division